MASLLRVESDSTRQDTIISEQVLYMLYSDEEYIAPKRLYDQEVAWAP